MGKGGLGATSGFSPIILLIIILIFLKSHNKRQMKRKEPLQKTKFLTEAEESSLSLDYCCTQNYLDILYPNPKPR